MSSFCKIDTGDWVSSAWGFSPEWTPYAQEIADHYPIQVPVYLTFNVSLPSVTPPPRLVQVTQPQQHPTLIFGASAVVDDIAGESGFVEPNFIYLNVTHQETGIPWGVPNRIGFFPLPAIAGIAGGAPAQAPEVFITSIVKLPEAFFLPAHHRLKLEWTRLGQLTVTTLRMTFVGVQLIHPQPGFRAPTKITMPNGNEIAVGSRLPWLATVPIGRFSGGGQVGVFPVGEQVSQFLPPQDCDVEIHDCFSNDAGILIQSKLTDMGSHTDWTPNFTPQEAIFGFMRQVNPALPFAKPHLLRRGHRMQIAMVNNNPALIFGGLTATMRGVRLCEY